jgi:hypothetical protein
MRNANEANAKMSFIIISPLLYVPGWCRVVEIQQQRLLTPVFIPPGS